MKLYYLTGACSLASVMALREAGLKCELVKVDRKTVVRAGEPAHLDPCTTLATPTAPAEGLAGNVAGKRPGRLSQRNGGDVDTALGGRKRGRDRTQRHRS